MTVFSRSNNNELSALMSSLLPEWAVFRQCDWFNHWTDAQSYLHFIIEQGEGWVINCDNDCFIHGNLAPLIKHMRDNGYTHCGMRDAGVSPHRNNDAEVMNPFFNIFNTDEIKPLLPTISEVANNIEPYNAFFKHLHMNGRPLYLDASTRSDGITTHLMDHQRNYIALHAWYSREWETQKQRILKVYDDAKHYKDIVDYRSLPK